MTSIFLSYARGDDEPFVRRLYESLTNSGFNVWFDRVSMPSRHLTFYQEIRDSIAACNRLVLVVGPKAIASEYVGQEWRFAYYEALKCVNPIVRSDGKDERGKLIDGYSLIPEDLRLVHAEDFRGDNEFDVHLTNLIRQLSEPLPPAGKLVGVPELPPHFVAQLDRIKVLREILLVDLTKPTVVSGAAGRVGLRGMGGIGKSVLASALAHQPEVRRAFPDGIYWVTLGQEPRIEESQHSLLKALGDDSIYRGAEAGKEKLREALAHSAALLMLDDVWQRPHADAFNVIGPRCRLLLTTRDAGLVKAVASQENNYQVQLPTASEAEVMLATAAGIRRPLPSEARTVIEKCGRLPLALALCGGMVRRGVLWSSLLEALRGRDLKYISDRHPLEQRHSNILRVIDASVHVLGSKQRERFTELAVFALDTGAPEAAVLKLWEHTAGLSPSYAREQLADFAERSLVERNEADNHIKLHDLVHDFATSMAEKRFGAIANLHQRLLDAYAKNCSSGWPSGLDDGYFLQKLCTHLVAADNTDDAIALLTNLPWLEAKCRAKQVFSLQDDYACVISAMPETQESLRQERKRRRRIDRWMAEITEYSRRWSERRDRITRRQHVNDLEPVLPKSPVTCRLWTDEKIEAECRLIREAPTRLDRLNAFAGFVQSECYQLVQFGTGEGFTMQHAINYAPGGPVHNAATSLLPLCGAPMLLHRWPEEAVWNPKSAILRTLEGHSSVDSVSVTSDGTRAVSCSRDDGLKVWDLESGACLRTLKGDCSNVSMTPDGRRAVTVCYADLQVWDLESGACLRTLKGHNGLDLDSWVECVSVTPDGRRAVSGGKDMTVRVWDLESGVCLLTLREDGPIESISVTPDGRRAVSGGEDNTIRMWDLEKGICLLTLKEEGPVVTINVTPDGRRAVSGGGEAGYYVLRVWDLESGVCLRTFKHPSPYSVGNVSITPDEQLAVCGGDDGILRVWDLKTVTCLRELDGHSSYISSVSVTADGRHAVSGGWDKTVRVWDLESGTCPLPLEGNGGYVWGLTPNGRRAVLRSRDNDFELFVWDVGARYLHPLEIFGDARSICMTPDGRRALTGHEDSMLRVWDLESRVCLRTLKGHRSWVDSVSVTQDGWRAVSASEDNTLRVWDLKSGICLRTLKGHNQYINCVSVTPDGHRAVSASKDEETLRLWDLKSGVCLRIVEGYGGNLCTVTPDGRHAVLGTDHHVMRVLDFESWAWLGTFEGHSDEITSMNVTSDGRHLVSGSWDGTVRVWDLSGDACLAVFVATAPVTAVVIPSEHLIIGTRTGQVLVAEMRNLPLGPVIPVAAAPDTSDAAYEVSLRHGLDLCRKKGADHEETFAYIEALAVQLDRMGKTDEARSLHKELGEMREKPAERRANTRRK